jgi:hypothetical protein
LQVKVQTGGNRCSNGHGNHMRWLSRAMISS